jgi:hypothetical protein
VVVFITKVAAGCCLIESALGADIDKKANDEAVEPTKIDSLQQHIQQMETENLKDLVKYGLFYNFKLS